MEFIAFIGMIALVFANMNLSRRIAKLEEHAVKKESRHDFLSAPSVTRKIEPVATEYHKGEPLWIEKFFAWLKEDWLLKLGALLLLISFGWFVSYAFLHDWIGPMGRITLGMIAGAGVMAFGAWRIKTHVHQGSVFTALGSAFIIYTLYAAREYYDFFTPATVLAVMFLSTAFVAYMSVVFKNKSLALAGLILASMAPVFTVSPEPNYIALFAYLFAVVAGAIWVVALTHFRWLTLIALIIFGVYSAPHLVESISSDRSVLLLFAYAFAGLFFASNSAGILRSPHKKSHVDLVSAGLNGILLLSWIMNAAPEHLQSLIISAWMVVFMVGAFLISNVTKRMESLYVYGCVGAMMLGAATAAELHGPALTIAFTIEAALIPYISYQITKNIQVARNAMFLLLIPIARSFESIFASEWNLHQVLHEHFAVLMVLSVVCAFGGYFLLSIKNESQEVRSLYITLFIIAELYAYALLWLASHAGFKNADMATFISLTIYTLIGLAMYVWGRLRDHYLIRLHGAIQLGMVTLRLLFTDVWQMALTGRIITFFSVGVLFMSTAFLGRNKKNV